jgi:hypothetical protein
MCGECPERVLKLGERIAEVLDANWSGGQLHVVLADENVERELIEWCLSEYTDMDPVLRQIGEDLLKMAAPERHMAIQMAQEPEHMRPWSKEYE